ncbi:MAG: potassium transporter TrkH [Planctomycetota bacterium]|nr:MAG: potassium transporter TrkH [Planctomycetota bacterium]
MAKTWRRNGLSAWRAEGILLAWSPLPLLAAWLGLAEDSPTGAAPESWRLLGAAAAALATLAGALGLIRFPRLGRISILAALLTCIAVMGDELSQRPALTLAMLLPTIYAIFALLGGGRGFLFTPKPPQGRSLQRIRSTMLGALLLGAAFELLRLPEHAPQHWVLGLSAAITCIHILIWSISEGRSESSRSRLFSLGAVVLIGALSAVGLYLQELAPLLALSMLLGLALLPRAAKDHGPQRPWWEPLVDHPARVLISTFFGLCAVGTALLLLPAASVGESLAEPIDAAFTAVSASCVTGLIVVDTASQLTGFGQSVVLLLIQLGGLGIMTISTFALYALGRRMSLRQERLMTEISGSSSAELRSSLLTIVGFTAVAEAIGAALLFLAFLMNGEAASTALWRAVFTSVSAFCNAGFALQTESLIPYAEQPFVLYTVSCLIIAGGMAPATCLALPRLLRHQQVPLAVQITMWSTLFLLVFGTLGFLSLEWGQSLNELPILDRLHNAWFQSATLRTAGFNSVDIAQVSPGTMVLMLGYMFVGGSPGGTAGGVKTTTVAILFITMWASIRGHEEVTIGKRTIPRSTVHKAIAVLGSSILVWVSVLLCLLLTQSLDARDLVFETTSALGTVGLSTGITSSLDELGKIIVLIAMFAGRVGPMTFLALLGTSGPRSRIRRPEAHVPLT